MREKERHSPTTTVLAIDTTTARQGVALGRNGHIVAALLLTIGSSHTETLLRNIDFLLASAGIPGPSLDAIAVVTGPGSFTGIRIGMATARGLADTWDIPLLGHNTLDLLARHPQITTETVCPLVDARRGGVYTAVYRRGSHEPEMVVPYTEIKLPQIPDFLAGHGPLTLLGSGCRHLVDEYSDALTDQCRILPDAEEQLTRLLARESSRPGSSWQQNGRDPDAFYIRPPDIRTPKRPV